MRICVVGSGYVGLVTGACLADFGMQVTGVDKLHEKVAALNAGEIPIYEPGLGGLVRKNMKAGRLRFTTDLGPAIEEAQAIFIAVGTPSGAGGAADLSAVHEVAGSIGEHLNGYKVIVTKSTVPIGTGQEIEQIVRQKAGPGARFAVVSNPEFLREGSAIEDFMRPDRVVIGTEDEKAKELMLAIYSPLRVADVPFVLTDVASAELIKYASNGFLAVKISFINEVARLCEALDANVEKVAKGMGLDRRIGPLFLHPGPGYGGSCFPKDTRAVAEIAKRQGQTFRIVEAAIAANEATTRRMVDKVRDAVGDLEGKTLGVLGLAFKPETDDIRESPALAVIEGLQAAGARIRAYDPAAMAETRKKMPDLDFREGSYEVADGADALLILTEWNQFRALELDRLRTLLRQPLIIDLRNIYEPEKMAAAGFRYVSVGRPEGQPLGQSAEQPAEKPSEKPSVQSVGVEGP